MPIIRYTPLRSICLVYTLFFLATAGSVVAVPKNWVAPPGQNKDAHTSIVLNDAEAAASGFRSGDTAYYLCLKTAIRFGTGAGTDCWGYRAPDGTEYAIFGIYNGIAVVNTSTLSVVTEILGPELSCGGSVGGPRWRDMKSYRNYVYVTSECTGTRQGVMIIDMSGLPSTATYVRSVPVIPEFSYFSSHNLSIDTMKGFMYTEALETDGYTITIHSLANPSNPQYVAHMGLGVGDNGVHDVFAWNDTLFTADGSNGSFSVYNMANKQNPVLIARVPIPSSGYVHNVWAREDLNYCGTTEETGGKSIKIWDINDLGNVQLVSEIIAPSNLAHNTHWKGDKMYISHYESGLVVVDVGDPANPEIIAQYDTWGSESPAFNGCWGAFPFTGNNLVYASNMDGWMYIFEEREDILSDTIWAETTYVNPGSQAIVDIYATNSQPIHQFTIPLSWVGAYDMTLASTTREGTRTDYFESETYVGVDLDNKRVAIVLKASTSGTSPDLEPGSGKIYSVTFDVPSGAAGALNPVTFAPFAFGGGEHQPSFLTDCLAYLPDTVSGSVRLNTGACCTGARGNVNGLGGDGPTVSDLTYLVSFLFNQGTEPPCLDEANINGSGAITVADLTYLVSFLFGGGAAPIACP